MATLNITIDPTQALAGAERIDRALDRIALSAVKASTAISMIERSAFKNLGILNQSFRTSTSQLKEFDRSLTKINPSMNKLSDGFGSVHRSSTLAIGSVTKFFGQMAIGVFLVGELVLIFSALARGISAVSRAMDSMEVSQITYQFAVMKDQIKNIVADVFSKFSAGMLESLQSLNKWIAQNRKDIENFLESTINFMKDAFDSIKSVVQFLIQHEEMLSLGIIGFAMFGKGRGVALASFVMAEKMIRMVLAMSAAVEAVQAKKITWGELFEKSGGLFGGTNQLEDALKQLDLLGKKDSGVATMTEQIKLAKMELTDLQLDLEKMYEKFKRPEGLIKQEMTYQQGKVLAELHEKYDPEIIRIESKIKAKQLELKTLQDAKENTAIPGLSRYSKEWLDAQKEIFKETKIITDDYYEYLEWRQNITLFKQDLMMSGDKDSLWAMTALRAQKDYSLWMDKNARSMSIYSGSLKETKVMADEYYKLLVGGENRLHNALLARAKTESEVSAEWLRHAVLLDELWMKSAKGMEELASRRNELVFTDILWTGDMKDIMGQMFGDHDRALQIQQDLNNIDAEFVAILDRFDRRDPALKREGILGVLFKGQDESIVSLQEFQDIGLMIQEAIDKEALGEYYDILGDLREGFDKFQETYTKFTGKVTVAWYDDQLKKLAEFEKQVRDSGLATKEFYEILEKLASQKTIKFLESQDDFSSGFIAGLLRLKDEIEPWGKTMSDAIVDAAHDMYNAMDDHFFNMLEGRITDINDMLEGLGTRLKKILAGFMAKNFERGFESLLGMVIPDAKIIMDEQKISFADRTQIDLLKAIEINTAKIAGKPPVYSSGDSGGGFSFDQLTSMFGSGESGTGPAVEGMAGNNPGTSGSGGFSLDSIMGMFGSGGGEGSSGGTSMGSSGGMSVLSGLTSGYSTYSSGQYSNNTLAGLNSAVSSFFANYYGGPIMGMINDTIVMPLMNGLLFKEGTRARLELGAGSQVQSGRPSVTTPFGLFGIDQAKMIDTDAFKPMMDAIKNVTKIMASVMSDEMVSSVKDAMSNWSSDKIRGDISQKDVESLFKDYLGAIGVAWGTEFGAWIDDFNGTLEELTTGIQMHVEAIAFTQNILDNQNLTEYDQAVNLFNDDVDRMRENLEETGGSVQELTDLEAAHAKGLADLRQIYADSFEMLKMQMGGMSQQNAQMVMWAKKFGTDVPTIIAGWEGIEAAIQSMTWEEFEAAVQASDMSIIEAIQMLLAFDAAAAATAAMIYDINIQSGQMAGMFSDLDLQIMSINQTFEDWIFQTKDLANAAEIAAELTVRWGKALEQASRDAEAAIKSALSNASWMSSNQQKDFYIQSIATTYGIDPNLITPANLKAWISEAAASDYVGWTAQMIQDASALWDTFFPKMEQSTENASNALDDLVQEAQKLANAWRQVIDSIQTDLDQMFFSQDNPQDVLERMQLVRKSLADLGTIDDPEEAEKARGLWKTLLDLGQEAWQRPSIEYQNLFNEVTSALESLREAAVSEEIRLLTLIESNTRIVAYSTSASMSANLTSEGLATSSFGLIGGPTFYVPGFQLGGVQLTPTLANIAEGGPEAIIPLHNGYVPVEIHGESMGDTVFQITIQIDGAAKDPGETRRQARDGVLEAIRSPEVQAELKRQRRWGG